MNKFFKYIQNHKIEILSSLVASLCISYGLSDFISFWKMFSLMISGGILGCWAFSNKKDISLILEEKEEEIKSKYDDIIKKYESTLDDQYDTIKNYEEIFDMQVVSLPCVCGNNNFEGIFIPNDENICECEKCGGVYRVTVNFDSVLISAPMDGSNN